MRCSDEVSISPRCILLIRTGSTAHHAPHPIKHALRGSTSSASAWMRGTIRAALAWRMSDAPDPRTSPGDPIARLLQTIGRAEEAVEHAGVGFRFHGHRGGA